MIRQRGWLNFWQTGQIACFCIILLIAQPVPAGFPSVLYGSMGAVQAEIRAAYEGSNERLARENELSRFVATNDFQAVVWYKLLLGKVGNAQNKSQVVGNRRSLPALVRIFTWELSPLPQLASRHSFDSTQVTFWQWVGRTGAMQAWWVSSSGRSCARLKWLQLDHWGRWLGGKASIGTSLSLFCHTTRLPPKSPPKTLDSLAQKPQSQMTGACKRRKQGD